MNLAVERQDREFEFLASEVREWRVLGWVLLIPGLVATAFAVDGATRGAHWIFVAGTAALATLLVATLTAAANRDFKELESASSYGLGSSKLRERPMPGFGALSCIQSLALITKGTGRTSVVHTGFLRDV